MTINKEQQLREKTRIFVNNLKSRFNKHVSDDMLVSILTHRLVREIESDNSRDIEHHAYNAAVVVFEQWIERGCKFIMNGHHVAQKFCLDFKDFKFDEDLIIDNG